MQCSGWMKHGDHKAVFHFPHLPMNLGDLRAFEEKPHGVSPQRNDDTGVNDFDLVLKIIAGANFNLIWQWIPIARWATFYNIGDKHIRACHARLRKQLVEKLPGGTHKRTSLLILVGAGAFADEHDLGLSRSLPRYSLRA